MIKRQKFSKIPIQGNFYPLAAAGYIEDDNIRMSIITGQPLGAASMSSGQFEVFYLPKRFFGWSYTSIGVLGTLERQ